MNSFRRAAIQVREASIIAQGQGIEVRAVPAQPGYVDILIRLLGSEPFRSLALAVRLVYQQSEPANFNAVCNLLHRAGGQQTKERVDSLRQQYRDALNDSASQVVAGEGDNVKIFSTRDVFEHWAVRRSVSSG